jgi:phosphoribosylformylglycinamidine cyclo-ligase
LAPDWVEGRQRPRCRDCRFVVFANPASASAGLVVDALGRVLLVRRALEPERGSWALPAGYQDEDESPSAAAEREVAEECGLKVESLGLLDLIHVSDPARRSVNLAIFLCQVRGGTLEAGDDALEVGFFALDGLPEPIGFDNARRILATLPHHPLFRSLEGAGWPSQASSAMSERHRPSPTPGSITPVGPAGAQASSPSPRRVGYREAGVDIDKKYDAVERAKAAIVESFTPGVVGEFGSFGGLFDLARAGVGRGLLVASADGVGTKLEVAKRAGVYHTVGRDLVHHCINDILVQGARPLFFMDYVAVGKLDPFVTSELIRGCARACSAHGMALLGGETAEMPGLYAPGDFDLAGFIVGCVEPDKLLDGSRTRPGQTVLGLESAGLHTNGYSLARKLLFEDRDLGLEERPEELAGASVGEALLAEHRCYLELLWPLLEQGRIAALAHVTGGGLTDNLPRVLGSCDAQLERAAWRVPPLFRWLVELGRLDDEEAYRVFNMGIGMALVVEAREEPVVRALLESRGERVHRLGRIAAGSGVVRWK